MVSGPVERKRPLAAAVFLVGTAVVLLRYERLNPPQSLALAALCVAWIALFALACLGAGLWVGRWLGWSGPENREPVVVLLAGAGTLAAAAFVLGTLGILLRPLLIIVLMVAAIAGGVRLVRQRQHPSWPGGPWLPLVLAAAALAFSALAVPTAAAFYDQLNYHLAMPQRWLRASRLVTFPRHDFSFLPANMSLLYAYAMAVLPVWTAQAVHWWMGLLAVGGAARLAASLGDGRGTGWAAALFAATPAVVIVGAFAASDLGASAFAAAAWVLVLRAVDGEAAPRPWRVWLLVGAFAGLAAGCKATAAATTLAPLALISLLRFGVNRDALRVRARRLAALVLGGAVTFAPWLIRSWVVRGDPVPPFLGSSHAGEAAAAATRAATGAARSPASSLSGLLLGTFSPGGEAGDIGPLYLALAPLVVLLLAGRGRRERRLLGGIALGVAAWCALPQLGRYLLPVLVLLAAAGGAALSLLLAAWRGVVRAALSAVVTVALAWSILSTASVQAFARIGCTLGVYDLEEWMRSSVDYWTAARFIDDTLPEDATLLLVAEPRSLYIERDVLVEDPFRTPLLVELAASETSAAGIAARLASQGVTHVLFNAKEGRRIAAMNQRDEYFGGLSEGGRGRLDRFLDRHLECVFEDGPVRVFHLIVDAQAGR